MVSVRHFKPARPSLYGLEPDSLAEQLEAAGFPRFHAAQILDWLYRKNESDPEKMTNLSRPLRAWIGETFQLQPVRHVLTRKSGDHTDKLLLELEDRSYIETVLIRAPQEGVGQIRSRNTVCVSSQVGCAYGCKFCASGLAGWKRNLTTAEILAQLGLIGALDAARKTRKRRDHLAFDNIVFMGMGEPLANYDAVIGAIRTLNADWGFGCGARRITVSTSGLVPEIEKLREESVQIRLAISLHGATNEVRDRIMPINRRYPLEKLLPAAKRFQEKHGRMLTLEFILIEGINDGLEQAEELAKIARDLHAHVNCIPYNTVEGLPWTRPSLTRQEQFGRVLRKAGISFTIRREKGHDIAAACGQLRLQQVE